MHTETLIREEEVFPYRFYTYETTNGFKIEVRDYRNNMLRYREELSKYDMILKLEDTLKTIIEEESSLARVYNVDYSE